MFLRCASLGLLLVLGAALTLGSPINPESPMAKTHRVITEHLKLTQPVVGSNPLFSSVIRSINNTCQEEVMLMNATLDVYMRIFARLLNHHQGKTVLDQLPLVEQEKVQSALEKLRSKMDQLRTGLGRLQQNKEDLLSKINAIKVDDPLVQKKALAEFLEVYNTVSLYRGSRQ